MTDDDLDLVETDNLVAALERRSEALVIAYKLRQRARKDGVAKICVCSHGDGLACAGLGRYIELRLQAAARHDMDEDEDW